MMLLQLNQRCFYAALLFAALEAGGRSWLDGPHSDFVVMDTAFVSHLFVAELFLYSELLSVGSIFAVTGIRRLSASCTAETPESFSFINLYATKPVCA